jgi:DNA-binding NarL/FixJ family response regulator
VQDRPRVVIVDDHPVFRNGIRAALAAEAWPGEIVEAGSVAQAMQIVHDNDIVTMDIYLPDGDGIDAARDLLRRCPGAKVVIVTMSTDRADYDRAIAAGVHGYVGKAAEPATMAEAFGTVIDGGFYKVPPPVAPVAQPPAASLPPPFDKLTTRERTILARVVEGHKGKRIARDLDLSHQYVKNTLTRIYEKLGVRGRMEAAMLVRERGIGKLD